MSGYYSFREFSRLIRENRISARFPTAPLLRTRRAKNIKVRTDADDPMTHGLNVDLPAMKRNPESFSHNMGIMRNPKHYQDIDRRVLRGSRADAVAEAYIEHFKNNLLHIHDNMEPHVRDMAKQWYDTAHKTTKAKADQHGMAHSSVAAVYAAVSPQNDWDNNRAVADRIIDHYKTKQDQAWTPEMDTRAKKIWKDKDQIVLNQVRGRKLSELSDPIHKAMWIRTYDEAHNNKDHIIQTPTGQNTTRTAKTKWQSLANIAKGIRAIEANGDLKKISEIMGEKHKIRSFYNNIVEPNNPEGDVTIDTHAVAAAHLRPFSSNSMPVAHAFGSNSKDKKTGKSNIAVKTGGTSTGIAGTYPIYAEAYRRAARERGIKPREMQSITWEGARALFPRNMKGRNKLKPIHDIWVGHHNGEYDANEARRRIYEHRKSLGEIKYGWS